MSSFLNNFTYLPNTPTIDLIKETMESSTLPLIIELESLTDEYRRFLIQKAGCTGLSGQGKTRPEFSGFLLFGLFRYYIVGFKSN